jgi:pSer/pThr/pTyr-binding forkhead associated (FHA) protein
MMKKSIPNVPKPIAQINQDEMVGTLTYLAGGSGKIRLTGKLTKIGKHPSSDIVVKGLAVGRTTATISKRPDGYYLSYVGGLSKPKVNEVSVKKSIALNDLDIINIGSTKLQFFEQKSHKNKPKTKNP